MQYAKVLKYRKDKNKKKSIISVIVGAPTDWCTFMVLFSTEKQLTRNAVYVAGKAQINGVFQLMTEGHRKMIEDRASKLFIQVFTP